MRLSATLLAVVLAAGPALADQDKVSPDGNYEVAEEHSDFISGYLELMKQHPDAAKRFGLVDTGTDQFLAHVIIWKCEDFGGALIPPECTPELLE